MRLYKKYDPDEDESDECIMDEEESANKNPPRISQEQSKSISRIFNRSSIV